MPTSKQFTNCIRVLVYVLVLALTVSCTASTVDTTPQKEERIAALAAAGVHADDMALIRANLPHLTLDHLDEIARFLPDPSVIADSRWFDVSAYSSWNDYNFNRPIGDTVLTILARRDLFLDASRQLNNPALTNMTPQALAALTFAQVYVEEKWDQQPPWDGDPNPIFNWVHPAVLDQPNLSRFLHGDELDRLRVEYWWATYWSLPLGILGPFGITKGTDTDEALRGMRPPNGLAPRLAGYAYPVGNQLYLQTAETVYWYADYLTYGAQRYGPFEPQPLDTTIHAPTGAPPIDEIPSDYPGLWQLLNAPFAADLRRELTQPERAAFWNVMRFVHAGARQREGGAAPDTPQNGQPSLFALRYAERTSQPVGRPTHEISAFALITTVYSDSLLLDFTNWNTDSGALIVQPVDTTRSDGIHRLVSERNKAIFVIEQMGSEVNYPNATHVSGSRGLDVHLTTRYTDPVGGDFLPYTGSEAAALVQALVMEARDYQINASRVTLCNSPLLRAGYEEHAAQVGEASWDEQVGELCK
jgi:hypothetical protein